MASALFVAAPWIATFYDTPMLVPITRVFSLNLIINSFGIVQNVLLTKELAFKKRMKASIASLLSSGAVGIILAWRGYGYGGTQSLASAGQLIDPQLYGQTRIYAHESSE